MLFLSFHITPKIAESMNRPYMNNLRVLSTHEEIDMTVVFIEGLINSINMSIRNHEFTIGHKVSNLIEEGEGEEEIGIAIE